MEAGIWFWVLFNVAVLTVLAVDLFVFHRDARPVKIHEAGAWVAVWVLLSLAFNYFIYLRAGWEKAGEFLTGYLIEYSLSVDNIFVFVLIFRYFRVPLEYQHRVLFWGVLGALAMRGAMIALGVHLIYRFEWILFVFGAFLIFLGARLMFGQESHPDPERNFVVRLCRRLFPMTDGYVGAKFTHRVGGRLAITPLFLVLVMVETTDLVFAVDSIPAIFAVSRDPFIVYTSNVCAIMGLRALYFLLAGAIHRLEYLKYSLGFVLAFIGVKMLLEKWVHIPPVISLPVIAGSLAIGVVYSLARSAREKAAGETDAPPVVAPGVEPRD